MQAGQQRILSHVALIITLVLLLYPGGESPEARLPRRRYVKRPAYQSLGSCEVEVDPLSAPARPTPSPSALPSLRAAPTGPLDVAFGQARRRRQARETRQCNQTFSDVLHDAAPRLVQCDDFARALRQGTRAFANGPLSLAPPCKAVFFSPSEACDLLAGLGDLVIFVGDSLSRQLLQGVFMVLSGSFSAGGVPPQESQFHSANTSAPPDASCACEAGMRYACREETFAFWHGPLHWVCPKWGVGARYLHPALTLTTAADFLQGEGWTEVKNGLAWGQDIFGGTTLVINVGLHDNLDAHHVAENVYNVLLSDKVAFAKNRRTRVICFLMPAPEDSKRRNEHVGSQGLSAVVDFNDRMRKVCLDRGAEVFEAFAATAGMSTSDGLHFPMAGNVLLAQLLLNQLAQGPGWERAAAALGTDYL